MAESVKTPCIVEAFEGDVVLECGVAATSLSPAIARDTGNRLVEEADKADAQQTPGNDD